MRSSTRNFESKAEIAAPKLEINPPLEVKSTPEASKYIRRSAIWINLGKPILYRCGWFSAFVLSMPAAVPLLLKAIINLIDGFFNRDSFIEAGKNLLGVIGFPLLGILSLASTIAPSKLGEAAVKTLFLPIRYLYKNSITPDGIPSLKKEVGPCETSDDTKAFLQLSGPCGLRGGVRDFVLPEHRVYPEVKGINGLIIDSADVPLDSKEPTLQYRIIFNAAAEIYQFEFAKVMSENAELHCHTRVFNYPGITRGDHFDSLDDLINAGIAEIYDLAKKQNWSNSDLEKHLHLYGYCLGGGVALQVAAYFKERHGIDLNVFVDRSFSSLYMAAANLIHAISGLPLWYSKILTPIFLFVGGELNMDSIAAFKKLNPDSIQYVNLGHLHPVPKPNTFFQRIKNFFGIGKETPSADLIIRDGASLADGLLAEGLTCGTHSTRSIFQGLAIPIDHRIYSLLGPDNVDGHFKSLKRLYMDKECKKSAFDYYVQTARSEITFESSSLKQGVAA